MLELTPIKAKALDIRRGLFQPAGQTLVLVAHMPAGERGYDRLIEVTSGWRFDGRTGQPGKLYIAELGDVTLENLQKARAFIIDGAVYALQGESDIEKPKDDASLIWTFTITPTGEPFTADSEESGSGS